jgi:hypothetical protein
VEIVWVMICVALIAWSVEELAMTVIWLVTVVAGGLIVIVISVGPLLVGEVTVMLAEAAVVDPAVVVMVTDELPPAPPRIWEARLGS